MTLLEEIQRDAVDERSSLSALLRKCKILAARLGSQALEDWLVWESNGYPAESELPEYRHVSLQLKGHFAGSFGASMQNAPIPLLSVPEKLRENCRTFQCRQSIASIESLISSNKAGTLSLQMGDLAVFLGSKVYSGYNCIQVWGEIGQGSLVEITNAVRNKALDFSLALWKEEPRAGEAASRDLKSDRVTQIFHTTVYGGAMNLVGSATNSEIKLEIKQGDLNSLLKTLRESGVPEADLRDLSAIVTTETPPESKPGQQPAFGSKVSAWIGKMVKSAASGGWQVGVGAAGNLLAAAIARYYGLPT